MSRTFWIAVAVVLVIFAIGYQVLLKVMVADLAPTSRWSATMKTSTADRTVTDNDNGSTVTLQAGDTVAIRLNTHSGGGYQYSLDDYGRAILRLEKDEMIEPNSTDARGHEIVGAGNTEQWTFTALAPGTTVVKLTNFRSFEPRPTAPTFTVTVTVQ